MAGEYLALCAGKWYIVHVAAMWERDKEGKINGYTMMWADRDGRCLVNVGEEEILQPLPEV